MHTIPILLVLISLAGYVLVIRQDWRGQLLWVISNSGWIYVDVKAGVHEQAALFGIYLLLALWGTRAWRKKRLQQTAP